MKEEKALLAGEMSGHMFFADRYFGYDDAIYASCRLIEILAKKQKPLSSLLADLTVTAVTPEIRFDCSDDVKFRLVEKVRERFLSLHKNPDPTKPQLAVRDVVTIDGIRVRFDDGWGLVRASNTQPALVLRFEANSQDRLDSLRRYLEGELYACQRTLEL